VTFETTNQLAVFDLRVTPPDDPAAGRLVGTVTLGCVSAAAARVRRATYVHSR
jgi:hypothetical protein